MVRLARDTDFEAAMRLYRSLTGGVDVIAGTEGRDRWRELLTHPGTTLRLSDTHSGPVAMATLHVLPNMTFGGRPYALIENVVTDAAVRGQGHGRAVMAATTTAAWEAGCYKIMLLTGRDRGAEGFYRSLGFASEEKVGMILRHPERQSRRPEATA